MASKEYEIIDFHTHPFIRRINNICSNIDWCDMSAENTKRDLMSIGISKICGCVASYGRPIKTFDDVKDYNDEALALWDMYGDFYVPGFHIHPGFIKESLEEIERMHSLGVNLVGELVPYLQDWNGMNYASPELYEILELVEHYDMVVSIHSCDDDALDKLVSDHQHLRMVVAHPGEYGDFERQLRRMKLNETLCLDVSGYGLFRHGMLRRAIDECGVDRIVFGSDYPTCNPAMYIGGVKDDFLITEDEKKKILSGNAKRLLGLE